MKKFLLMMLVSGPALAAGDALETELVCNRVLQSGQVDQGITLVLESNPYAWAKRLTVYEYGYLGERLIANVNVPLQPEGGIYRGEGVELDIAQGRAVAWLQPEVFDVACE